MDKDAKVLEIGSGCGAITGKLDFQKFVLHIPITIEIFARIIFIVK